jgi:hypothetical protein
MQTIDLLGRTQGQWLTMVGFFFLFLSALEGDDDYTFYGILHTILSHLD